MYFLVTNIVNAFEINYRRNIDFGLSRLSKFKVMVTYFINKNIKDWNTN